jgi:hypothetical protein
MEFEVEDGTGVAGATAYIEVAYLYTYAAATGQEPGSGDPQGAIIRASAWIDAQFEKECSGTRTNGRSQGLAQPRANQTDAEGNAVPDDEVPIEWLKATAEAAIRETAATGALNPDQAAGAQIKREKLGSLEVEYAVAEGQRANPPWYPAIAGILAPLIGTVDPYAPAWHWR